MLACERRVPLARGKPTAPLDAITMYLPSRAVEHDSSARGVWLATLTGVTSQAGWINWALRVDFVMTPRHHLFSAVQNLCKKGTKEAY
jgi:hypothetical protein